VRQAALEALEGRGKVAKLLIELLVLRERLLVPPACPRWSRQPKPMSFTTPALSTTKMRKATSPRKYPDWWNV